MPGTDSNHHGLETKPDYILILPWNLKDEICHEMDDVKTWGGEFVVAIAELKIRNRRW